MIAAVNRTRTGKLAWEREARRSWQFSRDFVGHDRDDTTPAKRNHRECNRVVAGKQDEIIRHGVEYRGHLRDIARGFFDANNVFDTGKSLHRPRLDVHASAPLHAVKNDRQVHSFGNGAIVLGESFLRRLVVILRDREDAIPSESAQFARQGYHFRGVVTARARENRNLPLRQLDRNLHDAKVLFVRPRRAFASRSARNEKIDARLDLPSNQSSQRCFVDSAVVSKWRNKSSAGPGKHGLSPCFDSLPTSENKVGGSEPALLNLLSPIR